PGGMRTHKRRKHTELYPPGKQLCIRLTAEPSDIRTTERHTGRGEPLKLQRAQAEVLPGGHVIPGPYRSIPLRTRIRCPGNGKWTFFLKQLFQSLVGGPHHLHAVDVMCFAV